jgi:hypothetical protein
MKTALIFVVTRLFCCCDGSGIIGWISIQSYPFNLKACGAAVNTINSDNRLANACGHAAMRCGAAVRRVENNPKATTVTVAYRTVGALYRYLLTTVV